MGLLERIARARLGGQVIRRLRRAGFTDARYDARGFRVRFTADGDETPTILELAPLLTARGRRRRGQVDRFVAGLVTTPRLPLDWAEARPLLRPVVRGGTPGSPLRRPVLPFLFEYVVVDQPDTMTYVGPDQPAGWGVSAEEVFAAARANLSGAVLHGVASEPVVVRFVDDGDAYWTSHLLLEHWLERLEGQVGGVPVAFAPERGTLLVTADGSEHLRGLFAQAEEIYAASSRPITPMAYGYDERGCTVPYSAPPGHPLHQAVRRAERVLAVREYTRQATEPPAEHAPGSPAKQAAGNASRRAATRASRRAATLASRRAAAQVSGGAAARTPGNATVHASEGAATQASGNVAAHASEGAATQASGNVAAHASEGAATQASGSATTHASRGAATQASDNAAAQAPGNAAAQASEGAATQASGKPGRGPAEAGPRSGVPMAELRLVGSDERGWRTRAIWERDEPVLLPEADEVLLGDQVCAWHEVLPHLRMAVGFEPTRWAADGWPVN